MSDRKRSDLWNALFFLMILCGYLIVTLFLFHRQTVGYGGKYISDVSMYIAEMEGEDTGFSFPYPILFWVGRIFMSFTTPKHAMAFAITALNGLTLPVLKYYFDRFLEVGEGNGAVRGIISTLLAVSILFASMLYPLTYLGHYHTIDEGFLYRYLGTFTPNPYHNATYLAARAFSVVAFFLFADILTFYEKEDKWFHRKYLCFSVFLVLATLAKPSFTLVLVSTAGIIMLWRLLTGRFRKIKAFFQMGIWFIPTFLVLLYQFGSAYLADDESGIGFSFLKAWSQVTDNPVSSVLLGTSFCLAVALAALMRRRVSPLLKFAWQFFLMALLMMVFLYEKGHRLPHLNFAWGYMYGLFFLYCASLIILAQYTMRRRQPIWQLGVQWFVYALHLICGVDYFRILLQGGLFH